MKITISIFLLISCFFISNGQNLVNNPSFEEFEYCPINYRHTYSRFLIPYWRNPARNSTSDYLNKCSRGKAGYKNFAGETKPVTGQGFAGIIGCNAYKENEPVFDRQYGEYLQTELKQQLIKDSIYQITFYYQLSSYSLFSFKGLGIVISKKRPKTRSSFLDISSTNLIDEQIDNIGKWKKYCFQYKASGGEQYLTIGRFVKQENANTKIIPDSLLSKKRRSSQIHQSPYVYIDDVSIIKTNLGCEFEADTSKLDVVKLNMPLESTLLENKSTLDEIVVKLKDQPLLKIYLSYSIINKEIIIQKLIKLGVNQNQIFDSVGLGNNFKLSFE